MRILGDGIQYHVIVRCNNGERLLGHADDCQRVFGFLKYYCREHKALLYAHSILPSHAHLLLETQGEKTLDIVMHDFCLAVARDYNDRHSRGGHFWRHRYRSRIVDDDRYALACLGYIDRNAIGAGLVRFAGDWPFCSYRHYADGAAIDAITTHPSYLLLGETDKDRQEVYRELVHLPAVADEEMHYLLERDLRKGSRRYARTLKKCIAAIAARIAPKDSSGT